MRRPFAAAVSAAVVFAAFAILALPAAAHETVTPACSSS
jgi:hypothetical protein